MNATKTDSVYHQTHYIYLCGKRTTFKVPLLLSSCKKKLKTGCSLKVVKNTMAMEDVLKEEGKADVSSMLKITTTVGVKTSNEVDLVKILMIKLSRLFSKNGLNSEEKGVGFQLVSTQLDPSTMKPKVSKECVKDWPKCTTYKGDRRGSFGFEVEMVIDADFEEPGAILAQNYYDKELYVETIFIEDWFYFSCNMQLLDSTNSY